MESTDQLSAVINGSPNITGTVTATVTPPTVTTTATVGVKPTVTAFVTENDPAVAIPTITEPMSVDPRLLTRDHSYHNNNCVLECSTISMEVAPEEIVVGETRPGPSITILSGASKRNKCIAVDTIGGYEYTIKKVTKKATIWRCNKYPKCLVTLTQNTDGVFEHPKLVHGHEGKPECLQQRITKRDTPRRKRKRPSDVNSAIKSAAMAAENAEPAVASNITILTGASKRNKCVAVDQDTGFEYCKKKTNKKNFTTWMCNRYPRCKVTVIQNADGVFLAPRSSHTHPARPQSLQDRIYIREVKQLALNQPLLRPTEVYRNLVDKAIAASPKSAKIENVQTRVRRIRRRQLASNLNTMEFDSEEFSELFGSTTKNTPAPKSFTKAYCHKHGASEISLMCKKCLVFACFDCKPSKKCSAGASHEMSRINLVKNRAPPDGGGTVLMVVSVK